MTNFLNSRPFLLSHVCYAISFESFKRNWCGKNGAFFNKTKHLEGKNKEFWSFKETGVTGVIFKMKPKINIIDLRLLERSLYAPIFTNVKIARNYIIFWWKCGKSRSQIWHCDNETKCYMYIMQKRLAKTKYNCILQLRGSGSYGDVWNFPH